MAKQTYKEMVNAILCLINETEISDVSAATGKAGIIAKAINRGQTYLFTYTKWYSLYKTSTFTTTADTAAYDLPADFGQMIDLIDETSNRVVCEDYVRAMDIADPDASRSSEPFVYGIIDDQIRFYPIPAGTYTMRYRYYKTPAPMEANDDTSDLPIEVENALFSYAYAEILDYKQSFERSSVEKAKFAEFLQRAMIANNRKLNGVKRFSAGRVAQRELLPPALPSSYARP